MDKLLHEWRSFIENELMPIINNTGEILEGNIYSYNGDKSYNFNYSEKQYNIALCGTKLPKNSHILEIGFNSGFSALLLLMSCDPSVKITCVDINYHKYTLPCFHVLKQKFGDRIDIIIGDSTIILPKLNSKYDLIHIDGGHSTEIAKCDTENSVRLAKLGCIIIMDDVNVECLKCVWNDCVDKYNLKDVTFELKKSIFHSIKQL
jgi:predicted O-methyltransferase YrrM